jgi:hypothetical protein
VHNLATRSLTAADLRGPLLRDSIQHWKNGDSHNWMVRIGNRLLDWAEIEPVLAGHLDRMLASGEVLLDGDPTGCGMSYARYAMEHDDRHVEVLRLARRGRLFSADGYSYFNAEPNGPAVMLDEELIEAVGDLVHTGYLAETTRPGLDGTTHVDIQFAGRDALRAWEAA